MKVEKLIIFAIFLGLIQLAACERGKINDPGPNSLREAADSLGQYPGDSLPPDSIYKPDTLVDWTDSLPNVDTVSRQPIKAGDEFLITPAILADSLAYLRLEVVTKKHYSCKENYIRYAAVNVFGKIDVRLEEITALGPCETGTSPSKATIYFNRNNISPDSTYQLQITASGKQYNGSLKKSGTGYAITWPYESGIIFTKKSI
ncbi:hypothetical protein [Dyadobacter sp. CY347]|uniref:hypothetical protein n=1 Tax=Dyadobacter sp. CY347 TaxID=2909336 RepID=UPI001F1CD527|nr:hypothetical protein [Dyadobacter sp. CY347]MCF2489872.1 hypothetical protein [Dyadobacter sp. CY347]